MLIDLALLEAVKTAWSSGDRAAVERACVTGLSLGAVAEAACWAAAAEADVGDLILRWADTDPRLAQALRLSPASDVNEHAGPQWELRGCPSEVELADPEAGVEWQYFLDRFRRSLVQRLHLSRTRARGISAVFAEMVDNVVQHAGLGGAPAGIVAYEVLETGFSFAVADLGRGVLRSLQENPAHHAVGTDAAALQAAVLHRASRRVSGAGTGFADLARTLADMEGTLSFRSGCARLTLDGRGAGERSVTVSNSHKMAGFQVSVIASPSNSSW